MLRVESSFRVSLMMPLYTMRKFQKLKLCLSFKEKWDIASSIWSKIIFFCVYVYLCVLCVIILLRNVVFMNLYRLPYVLDAVVWQIYWNLISLEKIFVSPNIVDQIQYWKTWIRTARLESSKLTFDSDSCTQIIEPSTGTMRYEETQCFTNVIQKVNSDRKLRLWCLTSLECVDPMKRIP